MWGKPHTPFDDVVTTSIWGALRRSGLSLMLATLIAGGLSFAVLWMLTPSAPTSPNNGPLTALAMLLTFLFCTTGVLTRALFSAAQERQAHTRQRSNIHHPPGSGLTGSKVKPAQLVGPRHPVLEGTSDTEHSDPSCKKGETAEIFSIATLARHLSAHAIENGGFRTLISGATNGIDPSFEGLALAHELSRDGLQVIVLDWSLDEMGFARRIGLPTIPGFNDLVHGAATFEDVVHSLQNNKVQVIPSGSSLGNVPGENKPNAEMLNLLLDALDEVYDHIIVTAMLGDAQSLFEEIEGRFDAGVIINAGTCSTAFPKDPPNTFLNFEVVDIVLVRYHRLDNSAQALQGVANRVGTGSVEASP